MHPQPSRSRFPAFLAPLLLLLSWPGPARGMTTLPPPVAIGLRVQSLQVSYGGTTLLTPLFPQGQGTLEGVGPVVSGQSYPSPPIYSLLGRTFTLTVTDALDHTSTGTSLPIKALPPLPMLNAVVLGGQGGYRAALPLVKGAAEVPPLTWTITGSGASVDAGQGSDAITFTAPRSGESCFVTASFQDPDTGEAISTSNPVQVVDPPSPVDAHLTVAASVPFGTLLPLEASFTDPNLFFTRARHAILGQGGAGSDDLHTRIQEAGTYPGMPHGYPSRTFTLSVLGMTDHIPNGDGTWGPYGSLQAEEAVVNLAAQNPPIPSRNPWDFYGWRFLVPPEGGASSYFLDNLPLDPVASGGSRWLLEGWALSLDAWDASQPLPTLFLEATPGRPSTESARNKALLTPSFLASRSFLPGPSWQRVAIPVELPAGTASLRVGWSLGTTQEPGPRTLYFDDVTLRRMAVAEAATHIHPSISILPGQDGPITAVGTRAFQAQVGVPAGVDAGVLWQADAGSFQGALWTAPATPQEAVLITAASAADPTVTTSIQVAVAAAPAAPITFPALASSTVPAGAPGLVATVPDQPGCTYQWSIRGGDGIAGAGTSRFTFSAGAPGPLVLTCTVTNAAGLEASGQASLEAVEVPPVIEALTLSAQTVPFGATATLTPVFHGGTGILEGIGPVVSGQSYSTPPLYNVGGRTFTLTVTGPYGGRATQESAPVACQAPRLLAPPYVTAGQGGNPAVLALPVGGVNTSDVTWTLEGAGATLDAGQGLAAITFTAARAGETLRLSYAYFAPDGVTLNSASATVQVVPPPAPADATLAVPAVAPYGQPLAVGLGFVGPDPFNRSLHLADLGRKGAGSDDLLAGATASADIPISAPDFPSTAVTLTLSGLANAIPNGDGEWGPRGSAAAQRSVVEAALTELPPVSRDWAGDYVWRYKLPLSGGEGTSTQYFAESVPVDPGTSGGAWWMLEGWVLAQRPWDPSLPRPALVLGTPDATERLPFLPGDSWQRVRLPVKLPPGTRELRAGWSIQAGTGLQGQALYFDDLSLRRLALVEGSTHITPALTLAPGQDAPIPTGGTRTFEARVDAPAGVDTAVTWTAGPDSGSFQGNVWTAPAAPGKATLTATSLADPLGTLTFTVDVTPQVTPVPDPPRGALTLSATSVTCLAGRERTFTATVTGLPDDTVTWSLQDPAGGSLADPAANPVRYKAPQGIQSPGTWVLTATSNANPALKATATIQVVPVTLEALVDMADDFGEADPLKDLDGDGLVDDDDLAALETGLETE